MEYRTIDGVDVRGKRVIVRVDLNSPIDPQTRAIIDNKRIQAHAETVRNLAERGARVIVIAHQGRKGGSDFTTLEEHSRLLSEHAGRKVLYVPDVTGAKAEKAITSMAPGEVVLLGNLRELDEETADRTVEEHSRSTLVRRLSSLADLYVLDAFSVAHRNHASVVGFSRTLPSFVGPVLQRELNALGSVESAQKRLILVMGGNKLEECAAVIEAFSQHGARQLDRVLACGVLGSVFLKLLGHKLGDETEGYIEERGLARQNETMERILHGLGDRLVTPMDVACDGGGRREEIAIQDLPAPGMILDIGRRTAERYGKIVSEAGEDCSIVMKGTPGAYEKPEFRLGSRIVYESLAKSKAYTFIGGGDSSTALQVLGISHSEYSYVSLGGGALVYFLAGKPMPGLEALRSERQQALATVEPRGE